MKTKVVDLKKCCRTHLLINSGDLYLTISWTFKFPIILGPFWGCSVLDAYMNVLGAYMNVLGAYMNVLGAYTNVLGAYTNVLG